MGFQQSNKTFTFSNNLFFFFDCKEIEWKRKQEQEGNADYMVMVDPSCKKHSIPVGTKIKLDEKQTDQYNDEEL